MLGETHIAKLKYLVCTATWELDLKLSHMRVKVTERRQSAADPTKDAALLDLHEHVEPSKKGYVGQFLNLWEGRFLELGKQGHPSLPHLVD